VSQQNRCQRCNRVIPPLASGCVHCSPQTAAADMRFNVVKVGEPFAVAAPVSAGLPADVVTIGESAQVWYCRIGGQNVGPVTAADIRGAFAKGQINGQASVGIQGKQDWFPIRSLPQFSDILSGIRPAPTARPLPAQPPAGIGLPPPQAAPRRAPPATAGPPPRPGPAVDQNAPRPISSPDRDDKTEIVPPLPPPGPVPGAQYTTPIPSRNLPPPPAVLQDEIKRLQRLALILGIVAGALFITTAALLGLLAAG
jgi:GYF domain 2